MVFFVTTNEPILIHYYWWEPIVDRFPWFSSIFFLPWGPIQDSKSQVIVASPWVPLGCESFSGFPCFCCVLKFQRGPVWCYVGHAPLGVCLFSFSLVDWGEGGFGRKTTDVKRPCSAPSRMHTLSTAPPAASWPCSPAEVCASAVSTPKLPGPAPSALFSWEGSHSEQPTLWEMCFLLLNGRSIWLTWNSSALEVTPSPSHANVFHHLFVAVRTYGYLFYTLAYKPMLLYFIAPVVPVLAIGGSVRGLLYPFAYTHTPLWFSLIFFFSAFLFLPLTPRSGHKCAPLI